jgi:hypothetical protein
MLSWVPGFEFVPTVTATIIIVIKQQDCRNKPTNVAESSSTSSPVASNPNYRDGKFDGSWRRFIPNKPPGHGLVYRASQKHTAGQLSLPPNAITLVLVEARTRLPGGCMRRRNRNNITNRTLRGTDTSASKVETVRVHDNGTGNIREILSVQVCHRELLDIDNIGDSIIRSVNLKSRVA